LGTPVRRRVRQRVELLRQPAHPFEQAAHPGQHQQEQAALRPPRRPVDVRRVQPALDHQDRGASSDIDASRTAAGR